MFRGLTVRENVELSLGVGEAHAAARQRADELLGLMTHLRGRPPTSLPRRCLTATSGAWAPPEPLPRGRPSCSSTSPRRSPEAEVPEFAAVIRSRDQHDAGVLLIDHNMALIMDVCDRIQVLDQGRTLAEGTPAEVRANLDVAAAYLGESPVQEDGE